ncbi:uncharacterized [Tachysurus ichikawai]
MEGLTPTSLSSAPSLTALYTSAHSPPSAAHLPKKQHDKAQNKERDMAGGGLMAMTSVSISFLAPPLPPSGNSPSATAAACLNRHSN